MPKLNFISKTLFVFTLGFAMITSSFSSVSVSANSSSSSSASTNSPQNTSIPVPNYNPKINLIQNSFVYNNTTNQWENKAQSQTWQEKNCADLYSQGIKGIADYEDGISKIEYLKKANEGAQAFISYIENRYKMRNCSELNFLAKNMEDDRIPCALEILDNSVGGMPVVGGCKPSNFTPANNPVYAYQYTYQYNFPENLKSNYSEGYRKMTGMEGDYDGVMWTYTFYTHREATPNSVCLPIYPSDPSACTTIYQLGAFKPWENPSANNGNGGWLIYGVKNGQSQGGQSQILKTTINTDTNILNGQPNTAEITYDPNTKIVSWSGKYSYNSSSCTVLEKSEVITNSLFLFPGDQDIKNYTLFLTFKPVSPNQPCTADVGVSNFSGSQQLETTPEILKNFNSAFEFVRNR